MGRRVSHRRGFERSDQTAAAGRFIFRRAATTATLALSTGLLLLAPTTQPAEAQTGCASGSIALTFDDGPSVDTPKVLDVLGAHSVPATFFVLGRNVDERPQVTADTAARGHKVANHTYGHERLTELSDARIEQTIIDADQAIRNAGVEPTQLLRPPFGATDDRVVAVIEQTGYSEKLWSIDPRDWEPGRTAAEVRDDVLANLHDGAVVLLHDWTAPEPWLEADASNTIAALPGIITGARDAGYCFGYLNDVGTIVVPDAAAPEDPGVDRPAVIADRTWSLRESQTSGPADRSFIYGRSGDQPLMCDWNGDGSRTPGIVRDGVWHLRNSHSGGAANLSFRYGRAGDTPVCGDWNGDGVDTVAVRRGSQWHLRNSNTGGVADRVFHYGVATDAPLVGDWNGDGITTVGVHRGRAWMLRNTNSGGAAELVFTYGRSGDTPVVGDWQGAGHDRPGIVRDRTWHLRHALRGGNSDAQFTFDVTGDAPRSWR